MRKYLSTLHTRSDRHKKWFAFTTSLTFTLVIFATWSFVHFSGNEVIADKGQSRVKEEASRISPIDFMKSGVASSFAAIKSQFGEVKKGLEVVDLESEYKEVREEALKSYGQ